MEQVVIDKKKMANVIKRVYPEMRGEDAEAFLGWMEPRDIATMPDNEIEAAVNQYRSLQQYQ